MADAKMAFPLVKETADKGFTVFFIYDFEIDHKIHPPQNILFNNDPFDFVMVLNQKRKHKRKSDHKSCPA